MKVMVTDQTLPENQISYLPDESEIIIPLRPALKTHLKSGAYLQTLKHHSSCRSSMSIGPLSPFDSYKIAADKLDLTRKLK